MLGVGTVMSYVLHAANLAVVLGTLMLFVLMYYLNRLDKRLQQRAAPCGCHFSHIYAWLAVWCLAGCIDRTDRWVYWRCMDANPWCRDRTVELVADV